MMMSLKHGIVGNEGNYATASAAVQICTYHLLSDVCLKHQHVAQHKNKTVKQKLHSFKYNILRQV